MKIFVFVSLAIAVTSALQCYKCQGNECTGKVLPPVENCSAEVKFCVFRMTNNKKDKMACADIQTIPAGYDAVPNDGDKKCKNEKGIQILTCYCSRDKCNLDDKAFSGAAVSNLYGNLILTIGISLLMAKM